MRNVCRTRTSVCVFVVVIILTAFIGHQGFSGLETRPDDVAHQTVSTESPRATARPGASVKVEMVDLPVDYEDLVVWAMNLYDQAGLELPHIRITHHGDERAACGGTAGMFHRSDGSSFIELCTTTAGKLGERLVIHELAHAWAAHQVDEETKLEFQALRGWTHWFAHDGTAWDELGCEQAAEILVWGLSDRPIGSMLIDQSSCADFDASYRALTGKAPLNGLPDRCRSSR